MSLTTIGIIACIAVVAGFLSVQIIAVLAGQRSQRRQMRRLNRHLRELNSRLKSSDELAADAAREQAIEEENQRIRDLYEYGGC